MLCILAVIFTDLIFAFLFIYGSLTQTPFFVYPFLLVAHSLTSSLEFCFHVPSFSLFMPTHAHP